MTTIAITLFALACADLARAGERTRGWTVAVATGVVASIVGVMLLGAYSLEEVLLVIVGLAAVVGWVVTTHRPMRSRLDYARPLGVLAIGLVIQVIAMGWVTPNEPRGLLNTWVVRVPIAGGVVPAHTVLLVAGAMLAQLRTPNVTARRLRPVPVSRKPASGTATPSRGPG